MIDLLKCVSWSYDAYFYYYYFKDENNNCYFWKTKSAKLNNACYNNGQFLKPFEVIKWSIKESNRKIKSYNDEQYSEIVVEEWKLID